jgi:ComF family protein
MIPFGRALIDFFFPPRCPFCGEKPEEAVEPHLLCPSCLSQIKRISHPLCPRCGKGFMTEAGEDHLCSDCLRGNGHFHLARSFALYEGLMAEEISRFKYGGTSRLAKPLGGLLSDFADPGFSFQSYDRIIPVPLHPRRLRHRGYNQSLLLAREVSRKCSVPLDFASLRRIRPTPPQTRLSEAERQKNIRGAFAVPDPQMVRKKSVLLIDDVFTTGATVEECSKVLLRAGANRVDVLTLARAR